MVGTSGSTRHICYCYSPPRYLWHLNRTYATQANYLESIALSAATLPMRWLDQRAAEGVDHFIGISSFIARRIRETYGRVADVVYPPVVAKPEQKFASSRERFLLHLGRLVPYKRVDLAIRAAEKLG